MITIKQISTPEEITMAQKLLREYHAWNSTLGLDLSEVPSFFGFEKELKNLPGIFSPPEGFFLIACKDDVPAGCIALRPGDDHVCELTRLFVRPDYRRSGIGNGLVGRLIDKARQSGYRKMILDARSTMLNAHALYGAFGFQIVPAPEGFPEKLVPHVVFMELEL